MEKRFFYAIYLLITFALLISCESKKSNLEESVYFVENIPQIQDYIVKLKSYNTKLVVCSLKKTKNHAVITLNVFYSKYRIQSNFKYKNIKGVNFLFVDYNENLVNREIPLILIKQNIVTFDEKYNNEEPPYLKFFFCENNLMSVKSFDNIQLDDLYQEYRKNKKLFNEEMFFDQCE